MSIFMSCVITIVNTGIEGEFLLRWLKAWSVGFPLAFLARTFFAPIAKKITEKLTTPKI